MAAAGYGAAEPELEDHNMTGLAFSPRLPRCYWRRLSESKQTGQPDAFASDFRGFFVASWRAAGSTPCPSGGRPPLNPAELHREVLLSVSQSVTCPVPPLPGRPPAPDGFVLGGGPAKSSTSPRPSERASQPSVATSSPCSRWLFSILLEMKKSFLNTHFVSR